MKVLNIKSDMLLDQFNELLQNNPDCKFVHYQHALPLKNAENLITHSRNDVESYEKLITLTNNGFYLYMTKEDNISSFVHHSELPKLWQPVSKGEYIYDENGVVYSLTLPEKGLEVRNLLVVFSSMNGPIYMSSLMRLFTQNFSSLAKYISPDTAILRIADLGGVVGSYYMNSHYLSNNEDNIQKLISSIKDRLSPQKVVLYGASKGGTAALLYSLYCNYDAVIVDPILSDDHYLNKYNDLHFTKNIFPITKEEKFAQILKNHSWQDDVSRILISSVNSPQFSYVNDILLDEYGEYFSVFNNLNSMIKDHPDVAPNSLHMVTGLLNMVINDVSLQKGYQEFI